MVNLIMTQITKSISSKNITKKRLNIKNTKVGVDFMFENYNWLTKQDLTKFEGEWIIVARKSIVAHGHDLDKLYAEVDEKYPGEDRITFSVPKKGVYVL